MPLLLARADQSGAKDYVILGPKPQITPQLEQAFSKIMESEYDIRPAHNGVYGSPNRRQNLRFTYQKDGFAVEPRLIKSAADRWQVRFSLEAIGEQESLNGTVKPAFSAHQHSVKVATPDVVFDYTNSAAGMRQTFTIQHPPQQGRLSLNLALKLDGVTMRVNPKQAQVSFFRKSDGSQLIQYQDLHVWDATGKPLMAVMRQTGSDRMAIDVDDRGARYPVVVDPLVVTTLTDPGGPQAGEQFGFSVAYTGLYVDDDNQQGGILIGAPYYDFMMPDSGIVWLFVINNGTAQEYYGWLGNQTNEWFGYSVAVARTNSSPGAQATFMDVTHHITYPVNVYITDSFFPDIIVGAPGYSSPNSQFPGIGGYVQNGAVFVYYGRGGTFNDDENVPFSSIPDWTGYGEQPSARYGWSVAAAGLAGDGHQSLIVGAPMDRLTSIEGRAYIYRGSSSGLSTSANVVLNGTSAMYEQFGYSVAAAGDVNGDGVDDLIVGGPYYSANPHTGPITGAAFIYLGGSAGLFGSTPGTPAYLLAGTQDQEQFGSSVAACFDFFGSSAWDPIVGSPNYADGSGTHGGAVYAFHGDQLGASTPSLIVTLPSNQAAARFGASVAAAYEPFDTDGDGNVDPDDGFQGVVLAGAPGYSPSGGPSQAGAAFVFYYGNPSPVFWLELDGANANAGFGSSVAIMPDFGEFVVGAPTDNNGTSVQSGSVSIYPELIPPD